jgi:hypothetical protein
MTSEQLLLFIEQVAEKLNAQTVQSNLHIQLGLTWSVKPGENKIYHGSGAVLHVVTIQGKNGERIKISTGWHFQRESIKRYQDEKLTSFITVSACSSVQKTTNAIISRLNVLEYLKSWEDALAQHKCHQDSLNLIACRTTELAAIAGIQHPDPMRPHSSTEHLQLSPIPNSDALSPLKVRIAVRVYLRDGREEVDLTVENIPTKTAKNLLHALMHEINQTTNNEKN